MQIHIWRNTEVHCDDGFDAGVHSNDDVIIHGRAAQLKDALEVCKPLRYFMHHAEYTRTILSGYRDSS